MEGWLAEAWGQARSMESKPEWKTAELMGWTEKGGRIYIFYKDAEGGWWYRTAFQEEDGRIQSEHEHMFGDKRKEKRREWKITGRTGK